VGYQALQQQTDGANNVAIGYTALNTANTGESNNISIGYQSMLSVDHADADNNVVIGHQAGIGGGAAMSGCVAIGANAMDSTAANAQTGTIAIGQSALTALTSGAGNTAVGHNSLLTTATGTKNTAIGYESLKIAVDGGEQCTAVGYMALDATNHANADKNTAVGSDALGANTSGQQNTGLGANTGATLTTGDANVLLGENSNVSTADAQQQIAIGQGIACTGNATVTIGAGSNTASLGLDGSDTSWAAASSDERLKENIQTSTAGLSFVNDLRPVTYNWKKQKDIDKNLELYKKNNDRGVSDNAPCLGHEYGTTLHGFIAQEVKTAIDNHSEIKEGFKMWKEYDSGIQTVADGAIIPMLVKAVQELTAKVEALENK